MKKTFVKLNSFNSLNHTNICNIQQESAFLKLMVKVLTTGIMIFIKGKIEPMLIYFQEELKVCREILTCLVISMRFIVTENFLRDISQNLSVLTNLTEITLIDLEIYIKNFKIKNLSFCTLNLYLIWAIISQMRYYIQFGQLYPTCSQTFAVDVQIDLPSFEQCGKISNNIKFTVSGCGQKSFTIIYFHLLLFATLRGTFKYVMI